MTIQIGQLLLHLNELRQAFLGDGVSRGRTGRDVRSNPFEALGHLEASFGPGPRMKKRIDRRRSLQLDPNLPGNPFHAPQIRSVAVLKLESNFAGGGDKVF